MGLLFKVTKFIAENFIMLIAISLLVLFKVLLIFYNFEKHSFFGDVLVLINSFDTIFYILFGITFAIKHIYFKFSNILSFILYTIYPLYKMIKLYENDVKQIESSYRFLTYPFKTIARKELFKLIVRVEIAAYYDLIIQYKNLCEFYDNDDLFAEWFTALTQQNMSAYEILTARLKLPSPIVDKVYETKNSIYYFLFKFIQLRPIVNAYYLNFFILTLSHLLFKQYILSLNRIINELNSHLESLPFEIYDNGIYREYHLNSNEVVEHD